MASLALVAPPIPATSWAQDPFGTIHYTDGASLFRISGGGGQPSQVTGAPTPAPRPTDLKYGGTYRYFTYATVGTTPTNPAREYGDFFLCNEADGSRIRVTNFRGVNGLYTPTGFSQTRWSNDRNDAFVGFIVYNPALDETYFVRSRVSDAVPNWGQKIIAVDGQNFVPFDESDLDPLNPNARLEVAAAFPGAQMSFAWAPDGDSFVYWHSLGGDYNLTQLKLHVIGTPTAQDVVLFDEAVTGLCCYEGLVDVSPNGTHILFQAVTRKFAKKGKKVTVTITNPRGIVSLELATGDWSWALLDTTGKSGLAGQGRAIYAADGSAFAFTADRLSNGKIVGRGVYKASLLGDGGVVLLREQSPSSWNPTLRRWTR
jgi:hypothetical protein